METVTFYSYKGGVERSEVTRGAVDLIDDYLTRGTQGRPSRPASAQGSE